MRAAKSLRSRWEYSHFIPAAKKAGAPAFETLHLLAPAVRADVFLQQLKGLIGSSIKKTTVFTMAQDWEKRDNVARIYHKSLLYLVSRAFEDRTHTPILGMETHLVPALVSHAWGERVTRLASPGTRS